MNNEQQPTNLDHNMEPGGEEWSMALEYQKLKKHQGSSSGPKDAETVQKIAKLRQELEQRNVDPDKLPDLKSQEKKVAKDNNDHGGEAMSTWRKAGIPGLIIGGGFFTVFKFLGGTLLEGLGIKLTDGDHGTKTKKPKAGAKPHAHG